MFERINRSFVSLWMDRHDESGQAMTEYALVLTLLAVGVIAGIGVLTRDLGTWIDTITSTFP